MSFFEKLTGLKSRRAFIPALINIEIREKWKTVF